MKYSLIMPSYLSDYKGGAKNRVRKFQRAVESVLMQSHQSLELLILADGCSITMDTVAKTPEMADKRIKTYLLSRSEMWSNTPRNTGMDLASGDRITYIDTDDYLGKEHLRVIDGNYPADADWVFYNDLRYNPKQGVFFVNPCELVLGKCGTSNVTHRADTAVRWTVAGYAHDYHFLRNLAIAHPRYKRIQNPWYYVCHIPKHYDI